MSETYPFEVCRETFSKACRFKNQQNTISGEKPYPCTVCHRHIPVKNVERHFLKHVGLGINKRLLYPYLWGLILKHVACIDTWYKRSFPKSDKENFRI